MKEIKAIIQPNKLNRIRDAFRELGGFPGMTVAKVQGCSEHLGIEQHQSIRDELTDFSGKIRIELIAPDEIVPQILQIIHSNAYTGQKGDGILWVTEVVDFYRLCKPMN
ncbi:MAG: P-II family nitrogen regulator [Pseudomonadota bacterium]|jgi:nitrogen regulatory protein P-II 1